MCLLLTYSRTSSNGYLYTTARIFRPDRAPIHTLYSYWNLSIWNLPTTATSIQRPDNSAPGWPLWRGSTVLKSTFILFAPENEKHAPRKLFKNNNHFLEVSLSELCHDSQVVLCHSWRKQHPSASPHERALKEDLAKILIIWKNNELDTEN